MSELHLIGFLIGFFIGNLIALILIIIFMKPINEFLDRIADKLWK